MEYVILGLSVLSLVLHFVAPRTKTKADDIAAEATDVVKDALSKKPADPAK